MTYTREEYQELLKKQGKEKLNGQKPGLEYLVQAQVKMELLTGDQYWDIFLSYLQSSLEALRVQESQIRDQLCMPGLVDPNAMMEVKLDLVGVSNQAKAIEAIIGLPKAIMESSEKAKERLATLG